MNRRGFTLIELMLVVAILGTLAAIAAPKFAQLVRRSREGATLGNLGAIRSAVAIYYADRGGQFPGALASLTASGKYLDKMPPARVHPYHADSAAVITHNGMGWQDKGGWRYRDDAADANFGSVWVNCRHTDARGSLWSSY